MLCFMTEYFLTMIVPVGLNDNRGNSPALDVHRESRVYKFDESYSERLCATDPL